jgi:hypothetical protein
MAPQGPYNLKCEWICHPKIKKARAQSCENRSGKGKIVYWEKMPVVCNPIEGDD